MKTSLPLRLLPSFLVAATLTALAATGAAEEKVWHVKAFLPKGGQLDVKALDKEGKPQGVKAIEIDGNLHLLDIKAFFGEQKLPVKILVSEDKYMPVKAIGADGTVYDIKALTPDGKKLDVKGVKRNGTIIHIKAIASDGTFYGVKAISPEGKVYDVKGIKLGADREETKVNGVSVAAHIKALPQAPEDLK